MATIPPPRRTLTMNVLWFWVGLLAFAAIGVAGFFAGSAAAGSIGTLAGALLMAAVTAGLGVFAMRRRNIPLGSGILVGYGLATLLSSGQCTLWSAAVDYGFVGGFIGYGYVLGGALLLLLVVAVGEAIARAAQGR